MQRIATCSCGTLKLVCHGDPELVALCHCLACQKRTGAPYGVAAFFKKTSVSISGDHSTYERGSDSGHPIAFKFCSRCGSTVFWEPSRKPDMIAVGSGFFGDPEFPAPDKEVHTHTRHGWVQPLNHSKL
ncbi:MAG: GFA family protein [Rhodobacteraceae bacterium]|nr:GFA family protein [Paracoccaceae bacterium]